MNRVSTVVSFLAFIIFAGFFAIGDVTGQGFGGLKRKRAAVQQTETTAAPEAAAPLLVENFEYAAGTLTAVSSGSWVNFSGTGNFIQVSNGGLVFANYPSSGIGNKTDIISVGTSAEDAHRQFATQTSGKVYAAFMVNVTNVTGMAANASTTGDYFAGILPSSSTTALNARVSIRLGVTAGTYQLGLRATSANAAATFLATELLPGTTYLVVLSYELVAGNSNDPINMWVSPSITGAEPAPDLTQTTATAADNADIARFFLRQGTTTTPNASVDGIRVGTTWDSVTKAFTSKAFLDFDNDGRSDYVVGRASNGLANAGFIQWHVNLNASSAVFYEKEWGLYAPGNIDQFAIADYDGDGKTDLAVWREAALSNFYIVESATSTIRIDQFGIAGDDPRIVGDYTGDGKADLAVYRSGAGNDPSFFYYRPQGTFDALGVQWGTGGNNPVPGDWDGDGKYDLALFTIESGHLRFLVKLSGGGQIDRTFGFATDFVVPGDFDGDGKADICIVRDDGGFIRWEFDPSSTPALDTIADIWGVSATDFPLQGDFNGDGKSDYAVYREGALSTFFVMTPLTRQITSRQWGLMDDYPIATDNVR